MIEPETDDILLGMGVPRLAVVRLNMQEPLNTDPATQMPGYRPSHNYAVIGEILDIGHYVLLNLATGKIMAGYVEMTRFELVPASDV